MTQVDATLLALSVISLIAGIIVAAHSGRSHPKEIMLTICAGISFTAATYSLVRIALLLMSKPYYCFCAMPWEMSQCYTDLITISGISGISGAMGAYLLGLAFRGNKGETTASEARTHS